MVVDKVITQKEQLDIVGATLLSIKEAEKLPLELRKYANWWWLRSPGKDSDFAASVNTLGTVLYNGDAISSSRDAVRPALQIKNMQPSNLQIGDIFEFGGKIFKIISDNLAFCLTDIGMCEFRKDWKAENANDYENSDVKKYVDEWFNQSVQENDYPCKYFDGREEKVYLTDFLKGILFAREGRYLDYIYKTVGRCRGTKNMERCDCCGDRSRCDFHSR